MKKKMFGFIAVMAMVIGFAMPVSAMGGSIVPPSEEANGGSEIFLLPSIPWLCPGNPSSLNPGLFMAVRIPNM